MSPQRPDQLYQYPAARDPGLTDEIEQQRYRGYAGGLIAQHRALAIEPYTASKIVASIVLAVVIFEGWVLALDWVAAAWAAILDFWRQVFGWSGYVVLVEYPLGLRVPYLAVESGLPGLGIWLAGAVLTILLFVATLFIPRRYLPVTYLLRIVVLFQACAQVFFALWPRSFPYGASGYVHGMLIAGLIIVTLVPVLLAFTYYIFDFSLGKKLGLTVLIMAHLALLIPFQYMAHAFVLRHGTLLFLPIMFFVFGLPLNILIFIGFYSWGVSWKSLWHSAERVPAPRALQAETRE